MHGHMNVQSADQFFNCMLAAVLATHNIKGPPSHSLPQLQKPILKQNEARFQSTSNIKPCIWVYRYIGHVGSRKLLNRNILLSVNSCKYSNSCSINFAVYRGTVLKLGSSTSVHPAQPLKCQQFTEQLSINNYTTTDDIYTQCGHNLTLQSPYFFRMTPPYFILALEGSTTASSPF